MGNLAFVGSHKVNGVSALHTELMQQTVFRDLHQLYPGPHRQQDQRHHAAPLAARGESRPDRRCSPRPSASACWTTRRRWRACDALADDARVPGAVRARSSRANKAGAGQADRRAARHHASIPTRCSTCRSSASTNTSASCSTSWRRSRFTTTIRAQPDVRLGAAREDLRRQGGGQLSPRQADHQAAQRRRQGDQQRPGGAATC